MSYGLVFRSGSTNFLTHLLQSLLKGAQRIKHWRCCITAKDRSALRRVHQCTWPKRSAAYALRHLLRPTLPPDKHLMDSHTDATVNPHKINIPNVTLFFLHDSISPSKGSCPLFVYYLTPSELLFLICTYPGTSVGHLQRGMNKSSECCFMFM